MFRHLQTIMAFALITALAAALPAPAQAQEEEEPVALTLESLEAVAYKALPVGKLSSEFGYGVQETLAVEGALLLSLDVAIAPPWNEELDHVGVEHEDIKVVTGDGQEIYSAGAFDFGVFKLQKNSLSEYRPYDWDEEPKPIRYNAVFAVPRHTDALTLHLGGLTAPVDGTVKVKSAPNPADLVQVEIRKAAFVEDVENTHDVGEQEYTSSVTSSHGKLLAVDFTLTPIQGNGDNEKNFYWNTAWISILCDNGYTGPTLGEVFMGGLSDYVSHNLGVDMQGEWSSTDATFFFAVPEGTSSFKLLYLGTPVAEAGVQ
jgi:hypothetical protein